MTGKRGLPQWVLEELELRHRRWREFEIDKLLEDPTLNWVWISIGKLAWPPEGERFPSLRLDVIGAAVRNGLTPLDSYSATSSSVRRRKAKKLARLADELREESEWISGGRGGIFPDGPGTTYGMYSYFTLDSAWEFIQLALSDAAMSDNAKMYQALDDDGKSDIQDLLRQAFWMAIKRTPMQLDVIAEAAERWAEDEPELYRPNDPNAQRLLFIRRVTKAFVWNFGRPLREETLALTGHYFAIEDLDAAALSRLAPVSKMRRRRFRAGVPSPTHE